MKNKIKIIISVAIILCAILAIYLFKQHRIDAKLNAKAPDHPIIVEFSTAKQINWPEQIPAIGTIATMDGVELRAQVAGDLTKIYVESGTEVKAGTALFQINPNVLQAQVTQDQAALQLTKFEYERYSKLYKKGAVSLEQLTKAKSQLDVDQAKLATTQQQLALTTIYAPTTGVVGLRQFNLGDYIQAGQVIATLQNKNEVRVDFSIPADYANQVKIGYSVNVSTSTTDTQKITGKVYAINSKVDEQTRMLSLRAELNTKQLIPGMYVHVDLMLNQQQRFIVVPQTAVIKSLHGDSVYKVIDGKAKPVVVQIGERRGKNIAILSGLKPGDVVISVGQMKVHPNAEVTNKGTLVTQPADNTLAPS